MGSSRASLISNISDFSFIEIIQRWNVIMNIYHLVHIYIYSEGPCANPESFVRVGPSLTTFFFFFFFSLMRGRIQIPPLAGHHLNDVSLVG